MFICDLPNIVTIWKTRWFLLGEHAHGNHKMCTTAEAGVRKQKAIKVAASPKHHASEQRECGDSSASSYAGVCAAQCEESCWSLV